MRSRQRLHVQCTYNVHAHVYDFNHIVLKIRTPYDCLIESIFFSGNTISNVIFIIPSLAALYFAFIDHMECRYKWCNASVFSMYLSIFQLFVIHLKLSNFLVGHCLCVIRAVELRNNRNEGYTSRILQHELIF